MRALIVVTVAGLLTGQASATMAQSVSPAQTPVHAPDRTRAQAVPTTATTYRLSEQAQIDALQAEVNALKAQVAMLQQRQDSLPDALFGSPRCQHSSGWFAVDPRNPDFMFFFCSSH